MPAMAQPHTHKLPARGGWKGWAGTEHSPSHRDRPGGGGWPSLGMSRMRARVSSARPSVQWLRSGAPTADRSTAAPWLLPPLLRASLPEALPLLPLSLLPPPPLPLLLPPPMPRPRMRAA